MKQDGTRWLIRRDLNEVLEIDKLCFPNEPWNEEAMLSRMGQPNFVCLGYDAVVEGRERIIGFMVYELRKRSITIHRFAVHPEFWKMGVGDNMMEKMLSKLSHKRRSALFTRVSESNLAGQLFLQSNGFWCDGIDGKDYLFSYRLWNHPRWEGENRISRFLQQEPHDA